MTTDSNYLTSTGQVAAEFSTVLHDDRDNPRDMIEVKCVEFDGRTLAWGDDYESPAFGKEPEVVDALFVLPVGGGCLEISIQTDQRVHRLLTNKPFAAVIHG
jgi:hypothetical protein